MSLSQKLSAIILPTITLSLGVIAYMMRLTRTAIIDVLSQPYIEMAILNGTAPSRIVWRHALPNALAPIINVVAQNLAHLIVGTVIVEVIFVFPGIGQLMVDAVLKRDMPTVQACGLIFASTYVSINLVADYLVIATNPRLRHTV
jgi:peptide/nickel transport system permease protein